jgi:mono/diheme cytochrome c family protein
MRLFKQLVGVFVAIGVVIAALAIFAFDVIKIDWVVFMELQPSFATQEKPLTVPAQSIPVEGAAYIPAAGAPVNPVPADETSIARGSQLFYTNCAMCHGVDGEGNGTIAAFFVKKKPANLTSALVQSKNDGAIFLTISNGFGFMPALNENFTVRERWDLVNFVRTLDESKKP